MTKHIVLDKFKPRDYQIPLLDAFEKHGYKRGICIWPRRSGKDLVAWNLLICAALQRVGTYSYVFQTFSSGRRILWEAITNDGMRTLDYIPSELIEAKNDQQMRIRLINGSVIQIIGSDSYDKTLVGTNAAGMIFSEYALQSEMAYLISRPILAGNDAWALFISTPRGKNHFYDMYKMALENEDRWFCSKLTVEDTNHIPVKELELERKELSEDLYQQEFMTSFSMGVEGSFYSKYIDRMRGNHQIGDVPWEPSFKVNTSWDLGYDDDTAIVFSQNIAGTIRIIDCYSNNKHGLEHYIKVVNDKPYQYGVHIAPHDLMVHEYTTGMTRFEKARQLGIEFTIADNLKIIDGIEAVRSSLSKTYIDQTNCTTLIKSLENYRQEYDDKRKVYKMIPLHDNNSHYADAVRYLCVALPKTHDSITVEEINAFKMRAHYGDEPRLPGIFGKKSKNLY